MKVAVVDLGTNTFNLLVAERKDEGGFKVLLHSKIGVMLSKGGMARNQICEDAYERAIAAFEYHAKTIALHQVDYAKGFATSAIRDANNGLILVKDFQTRFGIPIEIISGDREASLIYKGVNTSLKLGAECALIMDIGGGSVEFIICNAHVVYWKHSFTLGISRILEMFDVSNPMVQNEEVAITSCFCDGLLQLWEAYNSYKPTLLIGSSGSFDTFRSLLYGVDETAHSQVSHYDDYQRLHKLLLSSSLEERLQMNGMDPLRAEMIVLASILTNLVLNKTGITDIIQSDYALKEGAVVEILEKTNEI